MLLFTFDNRGNRVLSQQWGRVRLITVQWKLYIASTNASLYRDATMPISVIYFERKLDRTHVISVLCKNLPASPDVSFIHAMHADYLLPGYDESVIRNIHRVGMHRCGCTAAPCRHQQWLRSTLVIAQKSFTMCFRKTCARASGKCGNCYYSFLFRSMKKKDLCRACELWFLAWPRVCYTLIRLWYPFCFIIAYF